MKVNHNKSNQRIRRKKRGKQGQKGKIKGKKMKGRRIARDILERSHIFDGLKRQQEDILKFIYEKNPNSVNLYEIKEEFPYDNKEIESILNHLINENYITNQNHNFSLTTTGEEIANIVFRIHNEIEDYIRGRNVKCNAHKMAHILEHRLSEKQIEMMNKASEYKEKGVMLPNFTLPSGTIVDVDLNKCRIWTKLVSIGLFPGQKIHILNRTGSNYLIEIKKSKFAIDRMLAESIFLVP